MKVNCNESNLLGVFLCFLKRITSWHCCQFTFIKASRVDGQLIVKYSVHRKQHPSNNAISVTQVMTVISNGQCHSCSSIIFINKDQID